MKRTLLILSVAALLASCDSDSGTGPGGSASYSLKAGSSYTFRRIMVDTLGNDVEGSDWTFTDSVEGANLIYKGKVGVAHIVSYDAGYVLGDKYFALEANGDLSQYAEASTIGRAYWLTFPVQSRTPQTVTLLDSTVYQNGQEGRITMIATLRFEGTGTFSIDTALLPIVKIQADLTGTFTTLGTTESFTTTTHYSYAPSVGYFVEQYSEPFSLPGEPKLPGARVWLESYILK